MSMADQLSSWKPELAERPYAYIQRTYGLDFCPGLRVRLENTDRCGTVAPMKALAGHYVQVRFDGQAHASPCHPDSLHVLTDASAVAAFAVARGRPS